MDEQGYAGPATLAIGDDRYEVRVELRGVFQPIDGRFHWYGRVAAHDGLAAALGPARAAGTLTTPEGQAACEVSDPDPWQRYRVSGRSTPPFAVITDLPPEEDERTSTTSGPPRTPRRWPAPPRATRATSGSRSSAPGSAGWARPSRCGARAAATSSSWSGPTRSAAPGATTPIRAAPATCPRTCTRSRSRPTRTGRAASRAQPEIRALPGATSPTTTGCAATSGSAPRSPRLRWDADAARWRLSTSRGALTRGRRWSRRPGRCPTPALPDVPGLDDLPRRGLPLRALEPRLRPGRQAGRGGRHRGLGHPDRARDPARGQPAHAVPAHPGVGHAAPGPPDQRRRSTGCTGTSRSTQRLRRGRPCT